MTREELIRAVLADEKYMAEVRQAAKDYIASGRKGTAWEEVKKELGIK